MRITVNNGRGEKRNIRLPSGLLLNGRSANLLSAKLGEKGLKISCKQLRILFRAIKAYKSKHPEWAVIEVSNCDGESFEIVL